MVNDTEPILASEMTDVYWGPTPTSKEGVIPALHRFSTQSLVEITVLTFVVMFGTVGNTLVILVYSQKKQRQSSASLYMLNLAIADLITVILVVGAQISEYTPQTWPYLWRIDLQCILHRFGRFLVTDVTVYIMVAISVDRFIAVVQPLKYKTKCTAQRTKYLLMFIWLVCCGLAFPAAFKFTTKYMHSAGPNADTSGDACRLDQQATTQYRLFFRLYTTIVLVLVPALVTGFVYSALLIHVWRHNAVFSANIRSTKGSTRLNHWKIAKVLLAVYVGYMCCYVPYLIFNLSRVFGYTLPELLQNVFIMLPYGNSCMNPIFYLLLSDSFRRNVRKLFCFKMVPAEPTISITT
ncbi:somatostatin receptor type 4-like [Apostichopus japonicus]|uniref:somatostatin receptor type 4-like n=1 Tax=Stichopus japonicus TaxID=307972 RepID=UPI003AB506FD